MSVREGKICGVPTRLFRMSFTGDRGFEVNVPADYGQAVWEALWAEGQKHGACAYGTEAMHVLRAEKGYIIVGQDTDGTVTPDDAGLDWAIGKKKTDFVGIRGLTRPDLVAPGPQAAGRPEDQGSEGRAGGGRADRRRPEAADPDDDDRPCHLELLVGELRPLDRAGAGRRRPRAHGRDAATCRCRTARSRSRSARRCSSTRREAASMAKAAKIATAARSPIFAGREFSADGARIAVLAPAQRLALRAPETSLAALSKALGLTLPATPKTSVTKGSRTRALARSGRMAGHRRRRQGPAGRLRPRQGAALGGRRLAPQCRHLGHRPACGRDASMPAARRTCRSPPFRSAPARAPSSARSRSCFCAPPKTLSASNAGARSRITC